MLVLDPPCEYSYTLMFVDVGKGCFAKDVVQSGTQLGANTRYDMWTPGGSYMSY